MDYTTFAERCRERARNERHQARWNAGRLTVKSDSVPGERYEQHFEILDTGALWMHCDCPSGEFRAHLLVPCKHSTRWGDRMVRELHGGVKLVDGVYWLSESDTSRRSMILSTTTAADLCARRIVAHLLWAREQRTLTEKEQRQYDRLTDLLRGADR